MKSMILYLTDKQENKLKKYKEKYFKEDPKISKQNIMSHIMDNLKI